MADKPSLQICLCHLKVIRGEINANLARSEEQAANAAQTGADIIVLPEMALSGYGFESRSELASLALAADDPRLDILRGICRRYKCYLVLGLAELEPETGLIFNSALMWGPDGGLRARRRKVTAESKCAAAGPGSQPESVYQTPWGKIGLMICSEAYYSLVPRGLALAGADLLLSPANWPPSGLDPASLWRIRAMENGVHLAACNRTGRDEKLDCSKAESVAFDSRGNCLARQSSESSGMVMAELPLINGKLDQARRKEKLRIRTPRDYAYLAHDLRATADLTGLFGLPKPGDLSLRVACPSPEFTLAPENLGGWLGEKDLPRGSLVLLPRLKADAFENRILTNLAKKLNLNLAAGFSEGGMILAEMGGKTHCFPPGPPNSGEPRLIDLACARIALMRSSELLQPEASVVLAKRGCDLALVSTGSIDETSLDCLAARSLDKLAVAVAAADIGLISLPPKGHSPWQETRIARGAVSGGDIATHALRTKSPLERIDLNLLLKPMAETDRG